MGELDCTLQTGVIGLKLLCEQYTWIQRESSLVIGGDRFPPWLVFVKK